MATNDRFHKLIFLIGAVSSWACGTPKRAVVGEAARPPLVTTSAELLGVYRAAFKSFNLSQFRQVAVSQFFDDTLAVTTDAPVILSDLNLRAVGIHTSLVAGRPDVMALSEAYPTFGALLDAGIISAPQEPTLNSLQSMLKAIYAPLSPPEPGLQLLSAHTTALPTLTSPLTSTTRFGAINCVSTYFNDGKFVHEYVDSVSKLLVGYVGNVEPHFLEESDTSYIVRYPDHQDELIDDWIPTEHIAVAIPPEHAVAFASPALALKGLATVKQDAPTPYSHIASACRLPSSP